MTEKNKKPIETGDQNDNYVDYGQILASWQFPEYVKHERSLKWYVFFFIILATIILVSIVGLDITFFKIAGGPFALTIDKGNYLFVILIVLFLILYFYYERKAIENVSIFLTEDGVVINNKLIEYNSLDHFYLVYYPPKIKNLYLQPKNILRPVIVVPLENENPIEIREILLRYLQENLEKEEMPASESLSKVLKL